MISHLPGVPNAVDADFMKEKRKDYEKDSTCIGKAQRAGKGWNPGASRIDGRSLLSCGLKDSRS